MTGVVLRCPNCGTTQSAPGECDACHEASVRHFCVNHEPGRWLDGPTCTVCGARFGERAAAPASPPSRRGGTLAPGPGSVDPPRPPRATPPTRRAPAEERRPPRAPAPRRPPPPVETFPEVFRDAFPDAAPDRLPDAFPGRSEPASPDAAYAGPPRRGRRTRSGVPVVGCIVRLVLVLVLLAALAAAALVALVGGSGGLRDWIVDVGQSTGVVGGVPEQTRRGIAAYRAGDAATAERELTEAARLYPRSALSLIYLARLRNDAGDPARAERYLRAATAREPESAAPHRELGSHYLARSRGARSAGPEAVAENLIAAERAYRRALALEPGDAATLGYYGCTLAGLGRTTEAAEALGRAGPGAWQACTSPEAPVGPTTP